MAPALEPSTTHPTVDTIAGHYPARNTVAVVFTVDAGADTGRAANSVEEIADGAARHSDALLPFGSVDPWQGKADYPKVACAAAFWVPTGTACSSPTISGVRSSAGWLGIRTRRLRGSPRYIGRCVARAAVGLAGGSDGAHVDVDAVLDLIEHGVDPVTKKFVTQML